MKKQYSKQTRMAVIASGVIFISAVFQMIRGWDTQDFCLRLLVYGLAAFVAWRCRQLVGNSIVRTYGGAPYRFLLHAAFWVLVAIALFFGFRTFGS